MTWGLNLDLLLGTTSASGDPTLLTPALLTALGFASTRTGEVLGRRAPGGPGNYVRHAANDPEFDFTEVDGKNYPSLIVRGAATPLVSYSADLTNAAWTKTGCTADQIYGSMESSYLDGKPRRNKLIRTEELSSSTAWSATYISSSSPVVTENAGIAPDGTISADRVVFGAIDASGDVSIIRQSSPFGLEQVTASCYFKAGDVGSLGKRVYLYNNDNVDIRGYVAVVLTDEWQRVNVSGTYLSTNRYFSIGTAGSGFFDGLGSVADTNANVLIWGSQQEAGGTVTDYQRVTDGISQFHSLVTATADNATVTRQLTRASANRNTRWKIKAPSTNVGDVKVSQDNGSTSITLTPGEFADIELGEQTSANPTIWLQLTDDGDTVEHYDVQMAELTAGTPVPNFVPQGATPAATGFANLPRTIGSVPDGVDVELLVKITHQISVNQFVLTVFGSAADYWVLYKLSNSDNFAVNNRVGSVNNSANGFDVTLGSTALLRIRHSGTTVSWWKDGVAEADDEGLDELAATLQTFYLGSYSNGLAFANPIIAFRDLSGSLLGTAGAGFNISAIERYEASL
jgi:hypothetical protein